MASLLCKAHPAHLHPRRTRVCRCRGAYGLQAGSLAPESGARHDCCSYLLSPERLCDPAVTFCSHLLGRLLLDVPLKWLLMGISERAASVVWARAQVDACGPGGMVFPEMLAAGASAALPKATGATIAHLSPWAQRVAMPPSLSGTAGTSALGRTCRRDRDPPRCDRRQGRARLCRGPRRWYPQMGFCGEWSFSSRLTVGRLERKHSGGKMLGWCLTHPVRAHSQLRWRRSHQGDRC